ncbi:DNA-binding protein [Ureaplasma sp. ES3154-GEN]|uniref:YlxM family DNA-binding protein n=1 Tax=Ureaplasma sp. ES3154-GEN TaxID=2984844 RepID=UPI0021E75D69|nr:DNA-binding protein [Ureaplasma sp. ES3154-GEN]MCV3743523.1 DNA-binding protein [Ureaplasma sp. ES3154-GEN]
MTAIKERIYLINLFQQYKSLLTKKQQTYFQAHYYEDLSLNEIADINNVSKNAVYDSLDKITKLLYKYEMLLHLYEYQENRLALYDQIENLELKNKLIKLEKK